MANDSVTTGAEPQVFPPSPEFSKSAYFKSIAEYEAVYKRSVEDPEGYWAERAKDALVWTKKWDKVLEWSFDPRRASSGSRAASSTPATTVSTAGSRRARATSPPSSSRATRATPRRCTYKELLDEVSRFANVLKKHGVKKGDRVALYMPMIAELPIVMLACARIGAIHMMVFGGFSAEALKARIDNCGAKVLVCADKG